MNFLFQNDWELIQVLVVGFVASGLAAAWLLLALLSIPGIALAMKKEILKDYQNYIQAAGKKPETNTLKVILGLTD